jgi:hypothetical protein
MNLIDKVYNKVGYKLIASRLSVLVVIGIVLVTRNHIYIDTKFVKVRRILKLLKEFSSVSITGTGVLMIFYENDIVKYPLGNHSYKALDNEYNNYLLLKESSYSNLVEYFLEKKDGYFMMDKLFDIMSPVQVHKRICFQFIQIKSNTIELSELLRREVFIRALQHIEIACKDICMDEVRNLLKRIKIIEVCAMHGDLTRFNIMQNRQDNTVIIDLDRFDFRGIDKIDRIHFAIEYYAKKRKIDFFKILQKVLDKNLFMHHMNILFLYFIYRLGVEYNHDVALPLSYRNDMCKVINRFLISFKGGI